MASLGLPQTLQGGSPGQPTDDPSKRAAAGNKTVSSIFKQLSDAFSNAIADVEEALGVGIKPQDRGSAVRQPDVLEINAQNTPPASSDAWGPDNPEIAYNAHLNGEKEFRFLGINTGQGGNIPIRTPLGGVKLNPNHTPMFTERFPSFNELLGRKSIGQTPIKVFSSPSGKRIIDQTQVTSEASGASQGQGGGGISGGTQSGKLSGNFSFFK